jgi:hypothetical protein
MLLRPYLSLYLVRTPIVAAQVRKMTLWTLFAEGTVLRSAAAAAAASRSHIDRLDYHIRRN